MSERSPDALLWNFLRGAMTTKALAIVVDLGVPHALTDGPRPVSDLARDAGVDADALQRVLRALASDGVLVEEEPGVFGHLHEAQPLLEHLRLRRALARAEHREDPEVHGAPTINCLE